MSSLAEHPVSIRHKLAGLWTSLMLCYIYGDYFGLYQPGKLRAMLNGNMGPLGEVTQGILVGTSVMMAIPALMVLGSLVLKARPNRMLNMILGLLYTGIMIATMPGAWQFYVLLGIIEVTLSLAIFLVALRWPQS